MMDLGQRRDGALATAATAALLASHGRRNAEDRVHVGARRWLDELAGVGAERFEIAPLALREDEVEGESGLAAAGYAGHHSEAIARDGNVNVPEIVLARSSHLYRVRGSGGGGVRFLGRNGGCGNERGF